MELDLAKWCARWHAAPRERDRASVEHDFWRRVKKTPWRAGRSRQAVCAAVFGGAPGDVKNRMRLVRAPPDLWDEVEAGRVSPRQAATVMEISRRENRSVTEVLAIRAARPHVAVMNGREVRRRAPKPRVSSATGALIAAADDLSARLLRGVDDVARARLAGEFSRDVAAAADRLREAGARARAGVSAQPPGRRAVVGACRLLGMAVPVPGARPDMAEAKRQWRKLVRAYHPDAHGGVDATGGQYRAVMDAFDLLGRVAGEGAT